MATLGSSPTATSGTDVKVNIPKFCKAGVVTKEGPDFEMEVQMVPVPEPGESENLKEKLPQLN